MQTMPPGTFSSGGSCWRQARPCRNVASRRPSASPDISRNLPVSSKLKPVHPPLKGEGGERSEPGGVHAAGTKWAARLAPPPDCPRFAKAVDLPFGEVWKPSHHAALMQALEILGLDAAQRVQQGVGMLAE